MKKRQRAAKLNPDLNRLIGRQSTQRSNYVGQGSRLVVLRFDALSGPLIVGQLHHIVETIFRIIPPNLQHIDETLVDSRDGFEFLNAFVLALERPRVVELVPMDDFDGAEGAHHAAREPHFAITARANFMEQLVIRDRRDWL